MKISRRAPKSVAQFALGLLVSSALVLGLPAASAAHTPMVSPSCSELSLNLQYYTSSPDAPTPNTVTISVDGAVVATVPFGQWYTGSVDLGDPTVAHTWSVVIDAVDAGYGTTITGTSEPCAPAVPRDARAAVTLTPATCGAAEQVALGDIANATWGDLEITESSFSVTATAVDGHHFDTGMTTRTLAGPLAPAVPMSAAECAPAAIVSTQEVAGIDCETSMVTVVTTTTTTGWVFDAESATWVAGTSTAVSTTAYRPATQEECAVVPPDTDPDSGEEPPVVEEPPVIGAEAFVANAAGSALPRSLAHNGVDPALAMIAGAAFLGMGLALLRQGRRRAVNGEAR